MTEVTQHSCTHSELYLEIKHIMFNEPKFSILGSGQIQEGCVSFVPFHADLYS